MLLWSAEGKTDVEIASLMAINPLTVASARERWAREKRIADAPKPGRHKKLDGKQEAFVVRHIDDVVADNGRAHWSDALLFQPAEQFEKSSVNRFGKFGHRNPTP